VRPLSLIPLLIISLGCATTSGQRAATTLVPSEEGEWMTWPLVTWPLAPVLVEAQLPPPSRLVTRARALVGLSTLRVAAPHLPDDCTGLVRAVYEDSGIELMGAGVRGDNGVTAMYRLAFERSALHDQAPEPGDLVFFRETYDRNRDGKLNDGLTHVGVVESVDEHGTVSFVHRVHGGVKRGKLNAKAPLDRKRNDYLRPAKKSAPAGFTGELFVTFASASRIAGALSLRR
jgi:hypothetical protein